MELPALEETWPAKMIQAILVFNNHGKPRLVRFYQRFVSAAQLRHVPSERPRSPFPPFGRSGRLTPSGSCTGRDPTRLTLLAGLGPLSGHPSHPRASSPLLGPVHLSAIW